MSSISILSRTPHGRLGLQRLVLYVLIASVVVSAAMGVFALLVGEFEETQGKLLVTSLSVSGAGIVAMACGFAWSEGSSGHSRCSGSARGSWGSGC